MDFVDYASKALSIPSTVLAIWLAWLQIREIYRKRSRRSQVSIRAGAVVKHAFSLSQNVGIWLIEAGLLIGFEFLNKGFSESEHFLTFVGRNFIIIAVLLTFHIHWRRRIAEQRYVSKYKRDQTAREKKKASKRVTPSL